MKFQGPGNGGGVRANSDGQTDAELFAAGRRARDAAQCLSVIVATTRQGERNYHNCHGDRKHEADTWHGCGCGETWEDKTRAVSGPLTDVAFTA